MSVDRRRALRSMTVIALVAAVIALASPASAASPAPGFLVGKVTKVSKTSITITTSGRPFTATLTSKTMVTRTVRGKLGDLKTGEFVNLTLGAKNVVTSISVRSSGFGRFPGGRGPGVRPVRTRTPGARPPGGRFGGAFHGGQLVKLGGGKISVKSFRGQTTTYSLSKAVTVSETEAGKLSDLHTGQMIRIGGKPGTTTALFVIILST